ncbi:hypothetical protein BDC45DRAFT_501810 [Circinella umbellata]|nr:hypothetical protein BDC45DRAFT_501810 [Circinella umbellata]
MLNFFVGASPVLAPMAFSVSNVTECQTQACIDAAKSVKDYVDFNVDPCTDFYQYACGAWTKNAHIPDDKAAVGTFNNVNEENTDIISNILQGTYNDLINNSNSTKKNGYDNVDDQSNIDKQNFHQIQDYYNSCMDVKNIDTLGATPVYPMVSKLFKDFSVPETLIIEDNRQRRISFNTQYADMLTNALIGLFQQGIETIVSVSIGADDKYPDNNIIQISQPELSLPSKEYYEQEDILNIYRSGLVELLTAMIGKDNNKTDSELQRLQQQKAQESNFQLLSNEQIQDLVNRIVKLESKLANITLKEDQLQDPTKLYNPMSLTEIQGKYPFINWSKLFKSLIPEGTPEPETFIVNTPSYFTDLNNWLLSPLSSEEGVDLQTMQDFFMINVLKTWLYAIDTDTRRIWRHAWAKISSGSFELPVRSHTCVNNVVRSFGHTIGRYFVMRRFAGDEEERKQVDDFVTQIHEVWLKRLNDLDWLDPETRQAAIEKVGKIKHKIAYSIVSPDIRSPEVLRDYYAPIKIKKKSFFENELSIMGWFVRKSWSKVGKPVDKDEWGMSPSQVNAYYSPNTNEIAVPAGILQVPFYNYGAPWYLNYGSMGAIVGHELTHAFDSSGRMYNGDGKLEDWWSPETSKHFEDQSQCFVEQYDKFTVEAPNGKSVNVNGQLTLGENLADNGGIAASYQAFQDAWNNEKLSGKQDVRLPGIDLSPEALFYINFARTWCSVARPEALMQKVYTDVHSPDRYRVIGTVQNSLDFANVFQCPKGSPMNPEKKCVIW